MAPGDQEEETWVGTLGVGSVLAVCSGPALESALSWEMKGEKSSRPHLLVQLMAGAQRLFHRSAVVRSVKVEEVHLGALQSLQ